MGNLFIPPNFENEGHLAMAKGSVAKLYSGRVLRGIVKQNPGFRYVLTGHFGKGEGLC